MACMESAVRKSHCGVGAPLRACQGGKGKEGEESLPDEDMTFIATQEWLGGIQFD